MLNSCIKKIKVLALYVFLFGSLASCITPKKSTYFADLDSLKINEMVTTKFVEPVIRPDDILNVTILTVDPTSSVVVNQVPITSAVGSSSATNIGQQQVMGYLVDKDGKIQIPMLGSIKVGGLTTFQARDLLKVESEKYYKNPNVQVRYSNFKITVLGEVVRPATYSLPNERISVLDAIGLAGDLTIYGKRENVLIIREEDGKKQFSRVNLNSVELFKSPFYYLKQNDVLYVEPNKAKVATLNSNSRQSAAIVISAISVLAIILTRL